MGPINWTRMLTILLTVLVAVVLIAVALWVVSHFVGDVLILFIAAIVAYLLTPIVGALQARGLSRPLAISLVYVVLVGVLVGLGFLLAPSISEQAQQLQVHLPGLVRDLGKRSASLTEFLHAHGVTLPANNASGVINDAGPGVLGGVLNLAASLWTVLFDGGLVLVIAFYLLNDSKTIIRFLESLAPRRYAAASAFAMESAGRIVGRYVRAQILVAATVGVLGGLGAALLGVEYAPLIGIFAFFAESIPVLGPIIASVPAILIASLQTPWPWRALAVAVWFFVLQQLEQNVIMPRLSGHAVGIHPVAAIMSILIGFSVASVWGALFAVPLLGFAVALVREGVRAYRAGAEGVTLSPDGESDPEEPSPRATMRQEARP